MREKFKPPLKHEGDLHYLIDKEQLWCGTTTPHTFMENLVKDYDIKTINYPGTGLYA